MRQTRCWTEFSYAPVGAGWFFGRFGPTAYTVGCTFSLLRSWVRWFRGGARIWRDGPSFAQFAKGWEFLLIATDLSFGGFPCITLAVAEELSKSGYAFFCLQQTEVRFKPILQPHHPIRLVPLTRSKWRSRLSSGRECWRQSAEIQRSFVGIGVPLRLNSKLISA